MLDISSNKIIYLSPLGSKGIADIKKSCLFFEKVFVPVTWTTSLINILLIKEQDDRWKAIFKKNKISERRDKILKELEPLIDEGIIETDTSLNFNLADKVKFLLDELPELGEEHEKKNKFFGITDTKNPYHQATSKVLAQIDCYNDLFGSLRYTPCFNDPFALDVIAKCINYYETNADTSALLSNIKEELGIKKDIFTLNVICESLPTLSDLDSKKILKMKRKIKNELDYFRTEMDKYCIEILHHPYSQKFNEEIQEMIRAKINPVIFRLKREIETTKDSFILNMIRKIPSIQTWTSLGFSIFAGLPIWAALGIASGAVYITSLAEHKQKIKEIVNKNGFGIFLSIEKKLIEKVDKKPYVFLEESEPVIQFKKGVELCELGKYKKALLKLDKALELKSDIAEVWNNKAYVLSKLGENKGALNAFDEAIKLEPFNPMFYNNKSLLLLELNRNKDALINTEKAIELNPTNSEAWNYKGRALSQLSRNKEAIKAMEKSIELEPNNSGYWNDKSVILGKLNKIKEALEASNKAIKLKANFAQALYNRATLYSISSDKGKALADLSKTIKLDNKYKREARRDKDFKKLWEDEDFKRIVN